MASSQASGGGIIYRRSPTYAVVEGGQQQLSGPQGGLAAGVRGLSGAVTMERSEDEKLKYPDRINLDRKGLHGIPILEDEPVLRLLSLQHNFIKRIQHLDSTYRLVFLDLYHNRVDVISNLEPLANLRVLMLGKNRIRRIEGLQRCSHLSVLDLHGNRITQITGLDNLGELKVLNLAGNLIRKLANFQGLSSLEELNIRRNRIRSTQGLESVPSLEKLYMSNNEIQGISSLQKLDSLVKLHTVQMEGNPVWSSTEYAYHMVTSLPELKVLDQQEIASEIRSGAQRWKQQQQQFHSGGGAAGGGSGVGTSGGGSGNVVAKKQLLKKMEERNVSISNAKRRWDFLKKQDWTNADIASTMEDEDDASSTFDPKDKLDGESETISYLITDESSPGQQQQQPTLSASVSTPMLSSFRNSNNSSGSLLSRTLLLGKLNVPPVSVNYSSAERSTKSSPGSPSNSRASVKYIDSQDKQQQPLLCFPPIPIRNEQIRRKFPGLERRQFSLLPHQRFVSLHQVGGGGGQGGSCTDDGASIGTTASKQPSFNSLDKKIGYFNTPPVPSSGAADDGGRHCSDDLLHASSSSATLLLTDSDSESSSSDCDDSSTVAAASQQQHSLASRRAQSTTDVDKLRRNAVTLPRQLRTEITTAGVGSEKQLSSKSRHGTPSKLAGGGGGSSSNALATASPAETGRTSEQGRDYLIELDGDLLSVYGPPALKFLDRPWNRHRALKATSVQFNFVSFDDLVPYLPKFRQTFPNVENFEFLETGIYCLGQLNALALVQGITSLYIGDDGNPIYHKNWKSYAIYRLEHWGLNTINNFEFTDDDILEANKCYGSLGELAILVLPQAQITALIKKFDLCGCVRELPGDSHVDFMSAIKDPSIKEVIAKEALQYKPKTIADAELEASNLRALENLVEIGHSALHKLGRLEEEWVSILPILVKRIVAQYSDIRKYKRESLVKLEKRTDM